MRGWVRPRIVSTLTKQQVLLTDRVVTATGVAGVEPRLVGGGGGVEGKSGLPTLKCRVMDQTERTHTHIQTHTHTDIHTDIHTHRHTHRHTHVHTHRHTHTQTHTYHTHRHTHTRTHTHTHTHRTRSGPPCLRPCVEMWLQAPPIHASQQATSPSVTVQLIVPGQQRICS